MRFSYYVNLSLGLIFICFPFLLSAQKTNEVILKELLENWCKENKACIPTIVGDEGIALAPCQGIPTIQKLTILPPTITYKKLAKSQFQRILQVSMDVLAIDSSMKAITLSYQDTLSTKELRTVFRKSKDTFKGENPLVFQRFVKPTMMIIGSIAIIVSLFYLR